MAQLEIKHTEVFTNNFNEINSDKHRYILNQGGSRSSKTYSICQVLIVYCLRNAGKGVSIVRKSFPSLRGSILREFISMLKDLNIYTTSNHNKTEQVYTFDNGSWVEFFSSDNEQKLRGRKRDILYCNEGNELSFEEFNQLVLRTTGKVFIDFNPSDTDHWIYELIKDDKSVLIKSTYKDNPFLGQEQVDYIENLIRVDENYYKIYALGERPTSTSRIYTHFNLCDEIPYTSDICYGLDFGFNDPTALIKVSFNNGIAYCEEIIYKSKLTTPEVINLLKENIIQGSPIYADTSRPEIIEDIRRSGFNIKSANKFIKAGIDSIKSTQVYVTKSSLNILTEYKKYSWKSKGDMIYDEPVDLDNHTMDALRYAIHTHAKKKFNPNATRIFIV
jgi:phage terminase large subunit